MNVNLSRVLIVVGVAAAAVGFAGLVVPSLAVIGTESTLGLVALVVLLQGARVVHGRMHFEPEFVETSDPETEQDLAAPGDDFDETLAELRERPPEAVLATRGRAARRYQGRRNRQRDALVERIETAAVNALVSRHGWSRERAREAIRTGEWTDDPYAAALFTGEVSGLGLRDRVGRALSSERPFQRRAKHAAEAVAEIAEGEPLDADRGGST